MEQAKGVAAKAVNNGVQIELPDARVLIDGEGVLAEHLTRSPAFDAALAERGVRLLNQPADAMWRRTGGL